MEENAPCPQKGRTLKHNRARIAAEGEKTLVFWTRANRPFYREEEIHEQVEVDGKSMKKLTGVAIHNAISITFSRMAAELGLTGVSFYRLRHTFRTLAQSAGDREAVAVCMGHKDTSIASVYSHAEISWPRIKKVAKVVYRQLWPKLNRRKEGID